MMRKGYTIFFTFVLLLCFSSVKAQNSVDNKTRNLLRPNSVRLQYAGYVGMLSLGSTWNFKNDKLSFEYSIGYSPKQQSDKAIYTNSAKLVFTPNLDFVVGKKVTIQPLAIGILSTYTFGSRFGKYRDRSKYPEGYYWWSTSVRLGLVYQIEASVAMNSKYFSRLGFYLTVSVWDLGLFSYYGNSNRSYLNFMDIVILGSGCRLHF